MDGAIGERAGDAGLRPGGDVAGGSSDGEDAGELREAERGDGVGGVDDDAEGGSGAGCGGERCVGDAEGEGFGGDFEVVAEADAGEGRAERRDGGAVEGEGSHGGVVVTFAHGELDVGVGGDVELVEGADYAGERGRGDDLDGAVGQDVGGVFAGCGSGRLGRHRDREGKQSQPEVSQPQVLRLRLAQEARQTSLRMTLHSGSGVRR